MALIAAGKRESCRSRPLKSLTSSRKSSFRSRFRYAGSAARRRAVVPPDQEAGIVMLAMREPSGATVIGTPRSSRPVGATRRPCATSRLVRRFRTREARDGTTTRKREAGTVSYLWHSGRRWADRGSVPLARSRLSLPARSRRCSRATARRASAACRQARTSSMGRGTDAGAFGDRPSSAGNSASASGARSSRTGGYPTVARGAALPDRPCKSL